MANRISTIFDFSESGGLKKIKADVDQADGSIGKFKAAASGAFNTVKANAGAFAIGAGAAIATFGVKAAEQFTTLALDVEKFSKATGLSTEAASRWVEVAGDLGITTEQIQGGFVRLEKAIGGNAPAVKELGIEMVTAADGTADVSATMLQAIQALNSVQDPAKKAKLAADLFGRGFADMSELVMGDAAGITKALGEVSSAKIIDQEEINKAKKNRETIDALKDTFEDFTLTLGESALPAIEAVATGMQSLGEVAGALKLDKLVDGLAELDEGAFKVGRSIRSVFDQDAADNWDYVDKMDAGREAAANFDHSLLNQAKTFDEARAAAVAHLETMGLDEAAVMDAANVVALDWVKAQEEGTEATDAATAALGTNTDSLAKSVHALNSAEAAAEGKAEADKVAEQAAEDHAAAVDNLYQSNLKMIGGDIAVRAAKLEATTAQQGLSAALEEAGDDWGKIQGAVDGATSSQLAAAQAAVDWQVQQAAANGTTIDARTQAGLMASELRKLQAEMAPGSPLHSALQGYIDDLNAIPQNITSTITIEGRSVSINRNGDFNALVNGRRAAGGPVNAGGLYEVGEGGKPELLQQNGRTYLIPGNTGQVVPARAGASGGSGGGMSDAQIDRLINGIASVVLGGINGNSANQQAQFRQGRRP